jgi:hypothetical protein
MYKILTKHGQLIAFGIGLLVIVLYLGSVFGGLDSFSLLSKEDRGTTNIFDLGLKATVVLLVICAIIAVLFGIYHMVTNPKGAIKGIIGLVVIIILFGILYSMSTPETSGIVGNAVEKFDLSANESKFISAALKSTLILGALAALSFVVSEIRNFFK